MSGVKKIARFSPKRQQVIDVFVNGGVYTAPEIADMLPELDKTTVYRNLKQLVAKGLVKQLILSNGVTSYEAAFENHQHAICENCGKVYHVNIDSEKLKELIPDIDFEVTEVELIIKGHCKE